MKDPYEKFKLKDEQKNSYWNNLQNDGLFVVSAAREIGGITIYFDDKKESKLYKGFITKEGVGNFTVFSKNKDISSISRQNKDLEEAYKICDERLSEIENKGDLKWEVVNLRRIEHREFEPPSLIEKKGHFHIPCF